MASPYSNTDPVPKWELKEDDHMFPVSTLKQGEKVIASWRILENDVFRRSEGLAMGTVQKCYLAVDIAFDDGKTQPGLPLDWLVTRLTPQQRSDLVEGVESVDVESHWRMTSQSKSKGTAKGKLLKLY